MEYGICFWFTQFSGLPVQTVRINMVVKILIRLHSSTSYSVTMHFACVISYLLCLSLPRYFDSTKGWPQCFILRLVCFGVDNKHVIIFFRMHFHWKKIQVSILFEKNNKQEAHEPRVAHLSDIATADMQMLCNIFPILSSQLMKRSSFKQFFILKKKIYMACQSIERDHLNKL